MTTIKICDNCGRRIKNAPIQILSHSKTRPNMLEGLIPWLFKDRVDLCQWGCAIGYVQQKVKEHDDKKDMLVMM